ncbi:YrhB domain-containing protein [Kitasatospora sp. NPDC093558]|uniref:YrhB domain-containing protein n=1 Tax=Kitasatospora sp. NPDC093558 TaxID=3155201 RepID=UPI00341FA008
MNITKEQAAKLVEALLARRQSDEATPDLAIIGVNETTVGWVVAWQSAEYKRDPGPRKMLVGGGPYLVDGEDGSIFEIPGETFRTADWQGIYRQQFKGYRPPDPVLESVLATLRSDGQFAAIRLVRKSVPSFSISEAKAYVSAVQNVGTPPGELVQRTRVVDPCPPLPIRRISGPAI